MTPIQKLEKFLKYKHSCYTIDDVTIASTRGYLNTLISCPLIGKYWMCQLNPHYHTIGIRGIGYSNRDNKGRFISPYKLWYDLIEEGILLKADVDFVTGEIKTWVK
jgi:hypothetical protein